MDTIDKSTTSKASSSELAVAQSKKEDSTEIVISPPSPARHVTISSALDTTRGSQADSTLSNALSSDKSVGHTNDEVSIEEVISSPSPVVSRSQGEMNPVDYSTSSIESPSVKSAEPFKSKDDVLNEVVISPPSPEVGRFPAALDTVDTSSSSVESAAQFKARKEIIVEAVIHSPPSAPRPTVDASTSPTIPSRRSHAKTVTFSSPLPSYSAESGVQSKSRNDRRSHAKTVTFSSPFPSSSVQSESRNNRTSHAKTDPFSSSLPSFFAESGVKSKSRNETTVEVGVDSPQTAPFKPYAYYYDPSNETDNVKFSTSSPWDSQPEVSDEINTIEFIPLESAYESESYAYYCDPSDPSDPYSASQTFKATNSASYSGSTGKVGVGSQTLPSISRIPSYFNNDVPPLVHIIMNRTPPVRSPHNYDGMRIRHGIIDPNIGDDKDKVILTINTRQIDVFNITDQDFEYLDIITQKDYSSFAEERRTRKSPRKFKYTEVFDLNLNLDELMRRMMLVHVHIKPYKLNVYKKGSYFTAHNDLDRPELVGRLVLILPTPYTGGELCINQFNIEATMPKDRLRFVFFDIRKPHSINEVESGCRITLLYDVIDTDSPTKLVKPKVFFSEVPRSVLDGWICDTVLFCDGRENVLFGNHKYRNDLFYKLRQELKDAKMKLIDVFVEVNNPTVCYRCREKLEHLEEEDSEVVLDHEKYRVEHVFYPGESRDLENSMAAAGTTKKENCEFEIDIILACLINPVSDLEREKILKRGRWYTPILDKFRGESKN